MKQHPECLAHPTNEYAEGRGLMGWNWSWVELATLPDKFLVSGHAWWLSAEP